MGVDVQALAGLAALRRAIDTIGSERAREAFFAPRGRRPTAATLRVEARHEELRRLVEDDGITGREELAELLGVSVTCIERDAEALELTTEGRIGRQRREAAERRAALAAVVRARWGDEVPSYAEVADALEIPFERTRKDLAALGIRSMRRHDSLPLLEPNEEDTQCQ